MKLTSHDIVFWFQMFIPSSSGARIALPELRSLGDPSRDSGNLSLTSYTTKHGETGNYIYFFPAALSM